MLENYVIRGIPEFASGVMFKFVCGFQQRFNVRKFNKRCGFPSYEQSHNKGSVLPPTHLEHFLFPVPW